MGCSISYKWIVGLSRLKTGVSFFTRTKDERDEGREGVGAKFSTIRIPKS